MKKGLAVFVLVLVALSLYWFVLRKKGSSRAEPKPAPIAVTKHSPEFNKSIDNVMNAYLAVKDAFVDADTSKAKLNTSRLISLLDSIPVAELQKDSAAIMQSAKGSIEDIRSNATSLLAQTDITEMRQDFRMVTEMMYPAFFKSINYEGQKLYLMNCPMAFGEDKAADWISNSAEIVNPYLGKHHPEYKASMLHCGEVKDTIKAQ